MLISERIFNRLKEINMSQKEFSQKTKIAESTISDWKRKKLNPSADRIPSICEVLGISANELLGIDSTDYVYDVDEKLLIEQFRKIDSDKRERLLHYLSTVTENINGSNDKFALSANAEADDEYEADVELIIKKNLTRRLRKLARLDRVRLDESCHESGLNKHLFKYFDFIGIDKLEFIKDYLRNIQPFMISEIKEQEKFDNAICVIDEYYRISLYIKADVTKGEEVIVSFHENNKNDIAKRNSLINRQSMVYVFADSIGSHVNGTDKYVINLFICRGVRTFPVKVAANRYDDEGFLVDYRNINDSLISIVNDYLEDIYTSDLDFNSIQLFSSLQQLSFTSYGNDTFSNISRLIDSLLIQEDSMSKQIADSALCIYCNSLQLPKSGRDEIIDTLTERFKVNSVRIMPQIIDRVRANLVCGD